MGRRSCTNIIILLNLQNFPLFLGKLPRWTDLYLILDVGMGLSCSSSFLVVPLQQQQSALVLVYFIVGYQTVFLNALVVLPTFIYSCASPIGKQGRIQPLYLGLGCESQATVEHEVCRCHIYFLYHLIDRYHPGRLYCIFMELCKANQTISLHFWIQRWYIRQKLPNAKLVNS